VLSEIPEQWAKYTRLWNRMLRARRRDIEAEAPPDANDEYLFYQMLVSSWPTEITESQGNTTALRDYAERIKGAMRKSIREAKVHSTWASPNIEYEDAVLSFIDDALTPIESRAFLAEFLPFQLRVARLGVENSLVQTVLKLTVPGVPDMFQGSELWDLSLVDPDNRRPIDYQLRMQSLDNLEAASYPVQDLMVNWQDGKIKLFVIWRILQVRAEDPALFECGEYEPLLTEGPKADQLCGFARLYENRALLVLTARFPARRELDSSWSGTRTATPERIGSKTFRNIFTGMKFSSTDLEGDLDLVFDGLAVAVLTTELH
jgi:(1->4)-alpha-D-glucan 1-alpha-D-glucosylmutase